MQAFPFTSQVEYDEAGQPIYDRAVDSVVLRKIFEQYWGNGVFPNPSSNFLVEANGSDMLVRVNAGSCIINGATAYDEITRELQVQASSSLDRIDTVVLRLNNNIEYRNIDLYIVKGVPATVPVAPELTRTDSVYELGIANIYIPKNTDSISQQRITDTRQNASRCGYAMPLQTFDTTNLYKQYQASLDAYLELVERAIEQTEAGYLQSQIDEANEKIGVIENRLDSDLTANLLKPTIQTQTQNGVTLTNNGDGTFTVNGTASSRCDFRVQTDVEIRQLVSKFKGKKIKIVGCPANGGWEKYSILAQGFDVDGVAIGDFGNGVIININPNFDNHITVNFRIYVYAGTTVNNQLFKPMITTNLDATYEDFVPYTGDTGKLNGDVANLTRDALSIAELKMLGWNVPKKCLIQNEVNGNQFIQRVGRVNLGTLNWYVQNIDAKIYGANISDIKVPTNNAERLTGIYCDYYPIDTIEYIDARATDKTIKRYNNSIMLRETSYNDVNSLKSSLKGKYLYYELATPITKKIDGNEALSANGVPFIFDYKDGKYGFNTNPNRGADTFVPFKAIDLVGSYSGNQTINVSKYLKSGDTADNFIVEYLSISASSESGGRDSRGTSYWGNDIRISARTLSKALSGTNLVISNATVSSSAESHTRDTTEASVGCTSNISYRVWYKG